MKIPTQSVRFSRDLVPQLAQQFVQVEHADKLRVSSLFAVTPMPQNIPDCSWHPFAGLDESFWLGHLDWLNLETSLSQSLRPDGASW